MQLYYLDNLIGQQNFLMIFNILILQINI